MVYLLGKGRTREICRLHLGERKRMSKWMRVLVGLGITVLVCGVYLWFFGVQTFFALEARNTARKTPVVRNALIELPDLSISRAPGKKLSYFGYEFEVPWNDVDEARSRVIGGNKAIIAFRSGNVLSVWSGPPHELVNSVLASGRIDRETFRQIYGDEALQSDYAFHRIMLDATPDRITPFVSKKQAVIEGTLLLMKAISAPLGADSGIFAVRAGDLSGFQYGRLSSAPRRFSVELYSDRGSLDFIFVPKPNGPTVISQPDINRILGTLHEAPVKTIANASLSK
jgi:hypothetical protein